MDEKEVYHYAFDELRRHLEENGYHEGRPHPVDVEVVAEMPECPACGSRDAECRGYFRRVEKYRPYSYVAVQHCKSCHHAFYF